MSALSEPRRPRLLAQNRKLRHLKGLSLRNLCFAPVNRCTADDAALPPSPSTPRTLRSLQSSRSTDSLRLDSLRPDKRLRPPQNRKISLNLAQSPASRKKRLEALVNGSLGDVFLSLHVGRDPDPVYVSEMRQRSAVRAFSDCAFVSSLTCRDRISTFNSSTLPPRARVSPGLVPSPSASGRGAPAKAHGSLFSRNLSICASSTSSAHC